MSASTFQAWEPLIVGRAEPTCRAVVIVPARNEEELLEATLDALNKQVGLDAKPLDRSSFEILLLLNNCTDGTPDVAHRWKVIHPDVRLHVVQKTFTASEAFVGTARRMLMDTAWNRLAEASGVRGILSTDSDSIVAVDWIAQNMLALAKGADAVGGVIGLRDGELEALPAGVGDAYLRDRRYQALVAELEARLDPQDGDPSPRHLEHFGASLACTPEVYARAGGMPAVTPLEDVAFVASLRRIGARLRHHPDVNVFTSSRLDGRVDVGLSGQFRMWQEMCERGDEHRVQSAEWLAHRFQTLAGLRAEARAAGVADHEYLAKMDCDRLVAETFCGEREGEITRVNRRIAAMLENGAACTHAHRNDPASSGAAFEDIEPIALM